MTEPNTRHEQPTREPARLQDLDLLVRMPGRPEAVRAFTTAERAQAEAYAADDEGIIVPLPIRTHGSADPV